jgi:Fe-S cluster assembly protein SufD
MINFTQRDNLTLQDLATSESQSLPWLDAIKSSAINEFKAAKLPTRKVEHWKYNDMNFLSRQAFQLMDKTSEQSQFIQTSRKIALDSAIEIVFVDGYLASCDKLVEGIQLTAFDQADAEQQAIIKAQIDPEFDRKNLLNNLNNAINHNGFLLQVDKNVAIKQPIYIRYLTSANCFSENQSSDNQSSENQSPNNQSPEKMTQLTSQKLIIDLARSSQLTLIEHFESEKSSDTNQKFALQQSLIRLADNAQLNHYRLNLEKGTAYQSSQVKTDIGKDACLKSFFLGLGSRLNRTDIDVIHSGNNGESHINGIYLPSEKETIDYHTNIQHQVAHCNSNEVFRGIIADEATATFNGKIHIFQDAQKSDAYLNNKNLLLTNKAQINTKPELEIYADDVSCAHGATVAKIDEKSIYYLQTRGINYEQAKKMLSIAFIQELINTVELDSLKSFLIDLLDQYMSSVK